MQSFGQARLAPLVEDLDALAEAVRRLLAVRAAAGISPQDLDALLHVLRAIEVAVTRACDAVDVAGVTPEAGEGADPGPRSD